MRNYVKVFSPQVLLKSFNNFIKKFDQKIPQTGKSTKALLNNSRSDSFEHLVPFFDFN